MLDPSYNLSCFFCVLSCYVRSVFIARNYYFKSLVYVSYKLDVIIYRQSDRKDIMFGGFYLKCSTSCFCCFSSWIGWIDSNYRCSWYLRNYTIFRPWQIKLCFTVNQRQVKITSQITQMFWWNNNFCLIYLK